MHWRSLLQGSELYRSSSRSNKDWDRFYWEYVASRDISLWESPERLTEHEAGRLIHFVNQWATRSSFDAGRVRRAYVEVFPVLRDLKRMKLYDLRPPQPLGQHGTVLEQIKTVFETVANCSERYESTGASKILHTWLPDLCVMWDAAIAAGYGIYKDRDAENYSTKFLPRVSCEASEALQTYIADNGGTRADAAAALSKLAGDRPFAKLIDEHNYMKYTLSLGELWRC
jgi:hypothetical protein